MKRYLISILVIILVLSSGLAVGCGQDRPVLTEKQVVIDILWEYLTTKADQLQGTRSVSKRYDIGWQFQLAANEAAHKMFDEMREASPGSFRTEDLEHITIPLWGDITGFMYVGAVKKLAEYSVEGWWIVTIGDWKWQVNERTREVKAASEAAQVLLEEITLKTYHNSKYGYYLDYLPSWAINDEDKKLVLIFTGSPEAVKAFVFIGVREANELAIYKNLQGYIEATLRSLKSQYHEFEITEATPTRIDYTYMLREDAPKHEARHYFVQYGSRVYEIICSAELMAFGEHYSLLYDPYESFCFQP